MNNKELKENANGTNAEAVPAEKQPNLFKNNNLEKLDELRTSYEHRYFSMVYKNELRIYYEKDSTIVFH